jgi:hypothetical protein
MLELYHDTGQNGTIKFTHRTVDKICGRTQTRLKDQPSPDLKHFVQLG